MKRQPFELRARVANGEATYDYYIVVRTFDSTVTVARVFAATK